MGKNTKPMPQRREVRKGERADLPRRTRFFAHGVPGLRRNGGKVDQEWLSELRGANAAKVYREMADNDAIIGAWLLMVEMLLRQTEYVLEPADDSPEAAAAAEFCQTVIDDMEGGMTGFMTEFLTTLTYGWAWMEKLYKVRRGPEFCTPQLRSKHSDGRVGLQRIQLLGQETLFEWLFDEDDRVMAMVQMPPPPHTGRRVIPRDKVLHVRFRYTRDNPEGYSCLRVPYTSYYHKKNFQFVEAVGIERDLAGYPVMEVPAELLESSDGADTSVVDEYKDLVRKIKADEYQGVVIPAETGPDGNPSGFRLRLLNSGGRRPADVDPVIRRYDSRTAMSLMSEFLVVGLDKVGSLALHSDKTALFAVALGSLLDERDRQFNDEVFPELMRMNGLPATLAPAMVHGDIEKADLNELGSFLGAVTGSGVVTIDDKLEDFVRTRSGLPEADRMSTRLAPMLDGGVAPEVGFEAGLADDLLPATEPVAPEPALGEAPAEDIQAQVLNGAQIASLKGVVQSVSAGELPRDAAIGIISVSFQLTEEQAIRLLGSAGTGEALAPDKAQDEEMPLSVGL